MNNLIKKLFIYKCKDCKISLTFVYYSTYHNIVHNSYITVTVSHSLCYIHFYHLKVTDVSHSIDLETLVFCGSIRQRGPSDFCFPLS